MSLAEAVYGRIPESAEIRSAEVRSVEPLRVDPGSGPKPAISWVPDHQHSIGDRVLVIQSAGAMHVVGTLSVREQLGTVVSVSGPTATILTDDDLTLPGLPFVGTAPSSGDRVALSWGHSGGVIIGVLGDATPPPPPPTPKPEDPDPTPPPPETTTGTVSAAAVEVLTARSGSWRGDGRAPRQAYQGHWTSGSSADNTGWLFYGGALAVAGATVQEGAARITLTRDTSAGMADARQIRLRLTAPNRRPASVPAITGPGVVIGSIARGTTATLTLPDSIAQALLNGTAGGLVLDHPGTTHYLSILGPSARADAGLIRIPYTIGG